MDIILVCFWVFTKWKQPLLKVNSGASPLGYVTIIYIKWSTPVQIYYRNICTKWICLPWIKLFSFFLTLLPFLALTPSLFFLLLYWKPIPALFSVLKCQQLLLLLTFCDFFYCSYYLQWNKTLWKFNQWHYSWFFSFGCVIHVSVCSDSGQNVVNKCVISDCICVDWLQMIVDWIRSKWKIVEILSRITCSMNKAEHSDFLCSAWVFMFFVFLWIFF